jgi:DNA polymerase III subunit epsilon
MQANRRDRADTVVVLDFETTGLSPDRGDRAIEIGAVRLEDGRIRDRFQCLMNPGRRISPFIEHYTGISNAMLRTAPSCEEAMAACRDFIGDFDMVAHNAAFDQRFLDAELRRIDSPRRGAFACSMLAARRLYPDAPNHKLGTLVAYRRLPHNGTFHRALADAEMTAHLWVGMLDELAARYQLDRVSFAMMRNLTQLPKGAVAAFLQGQASRQA